MNFTDEQQKVIDFRGSNLLVSAAAGSGKTAVLVERIIKKISDSKRPVDVDHLLIMTFTRAAAAEMKDRLFKRIVEELQKAEKLNDSVLSKHLSRQTVLLRSANISTIDGFCSTILRNFFSSIDLDPSFRVAEEGELKLVREDVMEELLESAYDGSLWEGNEEKIKEFYDFLASYSTKKNDKDVVEAISLLYTYAQGKPDPVKWLGESGQNYDCQEAGDIFNLQIVKKYYQGAVSQIHEIANLMDRTLKICLDPAGPYMYAEALEEDLECFGRVKKNLEDFETQVNPDSYLKIREALAAIEFKNLKRCTDSAVMPVLKELAASLRGDCKDKIKSLRQKYFADRPEIILEDIKKAGSNIKMLLELTTVFCEKYEEAKREKNIVDFSDLEHLALKVLYEDMDNGITTHVATQYRDFFDEIMVDEYQDSNEVQEMLVNAICKTESGKRNVFTVGDVKQSIYRFRQAEPTLFMEKYRDYSAQNPERGCRIDLHRNFRSRRQVVDIVNFIFNQIMNEQVGGVAYDEDAALVCGASYVENNEENDPGMWDSELIFVRESEDYNDKEMEALAVANKIKQLMATLKVQDKETGELRSVKYSDMAILLRSLDGWDEAFLKMLGCYGIPVIAETKKGYFDSYEISTLINYLVVLNNPLNDEPLCGAMKSCFGLFNNEELAMIRAAFPDGKFSDAVYKYTGIDKFSFNKEDDERVDQFPHELENECDQIALNKDLQEKLQKFIARIDDYRQKSTYMTVRQLLDCIINDYHYDVLIKSMDDSEMRSMNLTHLLDMAANYETINYRGLFNFVRYINLIRQYEVDQGQAQIMSENDDCIRLMTIHKSKGLEFPVCFVCGMNKGFNNRDISARLVLDKNEGVGADAIDPVLRTKRATIIKNAIADIQKRENYGEELRVLYVALTRAREKLIMTGVVSDKFIKDSAGKKWSSLQTNNTLLLDSDEIMGENGYLSWVAKALSRNKAMDGLFEETEITRQTDNDFYDLDIPIQITVVDEEDMVIEEVIRSVERRCSYEDYMGLIDDPDSYEGARTFIPPAEVEKKMYVPQKVSVSYIKHAAMEESGADFMQGESLTGRKTQEKEETVPDFIKKRNNPDYDATRVATIGSLRGTAYHRIFELLDYDLPENEGAVSEFIDSLVDRGLIERQSADTIKPMDFVIFLKSDIGRRMGAAKKNGTLKREQPFCFLVPARMVDDEYPESEEILVQGIIDALFLEDGEYVIVDYKTDNVREPEELDRLYRTQLLYYKKALQQVTGVPVKRTVIYSVKFGCEVEIL